MSDEQESEVVEIKITLDSVYDNEPPKYEILLNDEVVSYGIVEEKEKDNNEKVITFEKELSEGEHVLKIRLLEKKPKHTIVDENNNILSDQILNIKQIEIDEIELDYLFYSLGKYHKQTGFGKNLEFDENPLPEPYKNLGYNGEWRLTFSVPTYIWFLENL